MKLTIDRKKLLEATGIVGQVIASRPTLPILSNIKLEVIAATALQLSATDLDVFISVIVEANPKEPGSLTIPSGQFRNFVNRVENSTVNLVAKDSTLEVSGGDADAIFPTLEATDFPEQLQVEPVSTIKCLAEDFVRPLAKVHHSMSSDEKRYTLQGVNISAQKAGKVTFAATNATRLSVFDSTTVKVDTPLDCIISDKTVRLLLGVLTGLTDALTIQFSSGAIHIQGESIDIRARLVEGRYPSFRQVIPKPGSNVFSCNRKDLIRAVETTSIFVEPPQIGLRIAGKKKHVEVSYNNQSKVTLLGSELNGQPDFAISFNYRHMLDSLKVLDEENVRMECSDTESPVLIREGGLSEVLVPVNLTAK